LIDLAVVYEKIVAKRPELAAKWTDRHGDTWTLTHGTGEWWFRCSEWPRHQHHRDDETAAALILAHWLAALPSLSHLVRSRQGTWFVTGGNFLAMSEHTEPLAALAAFWEFR
jgi:hypothetical protein